MFLLIFGILIGGLHNGTRNYYECRTKGFKPDVCFEARQLNKLSKIKKGKAYARVEHDYSN